MAVKYTEEQLNSVDKSFLIQLLLQQQEQLEAITKELDASNEKIQLHPAGPAAAAGHARLCG